MTSHVRRVGIGTTIGAFAMLAACSGGGGSAGSSGNGDAGSASSASSSGASGSTSGSTSSSSTSSSSSGSSGGDSDAGTDASTDSGAEGGSDAGATCGGTANTCTYTVSGGATATGPCPCVIGSYYVAGNVFQIQTATNLLMPPPPVLYTSNFEVVGMPAPVTITGSTGCGEAHVSDPAIFSTWAMTSSTGTGSLCEQIYAVIGGTPGSEPAGTFTLTITDPGPFFIPAAGSSFWTGLHGTLTVPDMTATAGTGTASLTVTF
jgi:hypothetical protein